MLLDTTKNVFIIAMIFQFLLVGAEKCLTHGAADDLRL